MHASGILVLGDDISAQRGAIEQLKTHASDARDFDFAAATIQQAEDMFDWTPGLLESDDEYANELPTVDTTRPFHSHQGQGCTRRQMNDMLNDQDCEPLDESREDSVNRWWAMAEWDTSLMQDDAYLDEIPMTGGVRPCMEIDGVVQSRAQIVAYFRSEEFASDANSAPVFQAAIERYRSKLEAEEGTPSTWIYDSQQMLDPELALMAVGGTDRRVILRVDTDEAAAHSRGLTPDLIVNASNQEAFMARTMEGVNLAENPVPIPEEVVESDADALFKQYQDWKKNA